MDCYFYNLLNARIETILGKSMKNIEFVEYLYAYNQIRQNQLMMLIKEDPYDADDEREERRKKRKEYATQGEECQLLQETIFIQEENDPFWKKIKIEIENDLEACKIKNLEAQCIYDQDITFIMNENDEISRLIPNTQIKIDSVSFLFLLICSQFYMKKTVSK